MDNKEKFKKEMRIELLEWLISIIIAIVLAFFIKYYLGTFTTVKQESMFPTLKNNERLWLDRTTRTFKKTYQRGDIVTFEAPTVTPFITNTFPKAIYKEPSNIFASFEKNFLEFSKVSLIKRIIGVPGDHIVIKYGKVYVNDKEEEQYLAKLDTESNQLFDFVVPEGHYFLMGDNRKKSTDSRIFGCVPAEKIEGIVRIRIWPLNKFGKIVHE